VAAAKHHVAGFTGDDDDVVQAAASPDDNPLEFGTRVELDRLLSLELAEPLGPFALSEDVLGVPLRAVPAVDV